MPLHSRFPLVAVLAVFLGSAVQAQTPTILASGTVNAADYSRDFAPGAIISIFGSNLATASAGAVSIPLPTTLSGTTVELVSGGSTQSLPLFYVSASQINTQLPYGLNPGAAQIRVRTAAGTSATDTINLGSRAPKIFTIDFSGKGSGVVTNPSFTIVTQGGNPVKAGDMITIWMNSLGETTPPVVAGLAAPSGSNLATISDTVNVTIGGVAGVVTFAGAAPGFSGLYQVNVRAPFLVSTGPADIQVSIGNSRSQTAVTTPYRQFGFYNAMFGGKPVTGQTLTGVSAVATRQSDQVAWGPTGFNTWVKPSGSSPIDSSSVAGEAVTLRNNTTAVYDNNGIEDRSGASFYSNAGGGADNQKAGLAQVYSMSNYFPLVSATYIRLAQSATITEMIGYFDGNGSPDLPFDPNSGYIKYRMNIWSNVSGVPRETGNYVGDVFSSDSTAGTFTISNTGVNRVSSVATAAPDAIWRLSFRPNTPITLPAGEYWFSHDASIRTSPATSSTAASITTSELSRIIRSQPNAGEAIRFSFFGQGMLYQESWSLPSAVQVLPESAITVEQYR